MNEVATPDENNLLPIEYAATGLDPNATTRFYFDDDANNHDGVLLDLAGDEELPAASQDLVTGASGIATALWNTIDVPVGDYFVYAVSEIEGRPPIFSEYSGERVRIRTGDVPEVQIQPVSPNPSNKPIDEIAIEFSEPVDGFDLSGDSRHAGP